MLQTKMWYKMGCIRTCIRVFFFRNWKEGSCLMRISLLRISLLRFFKTFHEYLAYAILCTLCYCDFWLMRFYVLFISLMRSICLMRFLANTIFPQSQKLHKAKTLCTTKNCKNDNWINAILNTFSMQILQFLKKFLV